jgi:hypothetical protein
LSLRYSVISAAGNVITGETSPAAAGRLFAGRGQGLIAERSIAPRVEIQHQA